jgi:hypothetical protein
MPKEKTPTPSQSRFRAVFNRLYPVLVIALLVAIAGLWFVTRLAPAPGLSEKPTVTC